MITAKEAREITIKSLYDSFTDTQKKLITAIEDDILKKAYTGESTDRYILSSANEVLCRYFVLLDYEVHIDTEDGGFLLTLSWVK